MTPADDSNQNDTAETPSTPPPHTQPTRFKFLKKIPHPHWGRVILFSVLLVTIPTLSIIGYRLLNNQPVTIRPQPAPTPTPTLIPTPTPAPIQQADSRIAFIRNGHIWTIWPDGSQATQVTLPEPVFGTKEENVILKSPVWSPNGQRIAFLSDQQPYQVKVSSGETLSLGNIEDTFYYGQPKWSPDNSLIAMERKLRQTRQPQEIVIVSPQGETVTEVTAKSYFPQNADPSDLQLIDWFPDSRSLLIYQAGDDQYQGFWQVSLDKSIRHQLTDTTTTSRFVEADLSEQGDRIVYRDEEKIWLFQMASDNRRTLKTIPEIGGGAVSYSQPTFSPNGEKIYIRATVSGRNRLYFSCYDLVSDKLDLFWPGLEGSAEDISWSPNSQKIAFSWSRTGTTQLNPILIIDIDTHQHLQITTNAKDPHWSEAVF